MGKEISTQSGSVEFKTLTFPNNDTGRRRKINVMQEYVSQGWEVVSESITPGKFRGGTACCLAMMCALPCAFCTGTTDGEITVTLKNNNSRIMNHYSVIEQTPIEVQAREIPQALPAAPITPPTQIYEPVIGLETEALIKRAALFLEDGEFDDAGRYLEQALNQDAENPRVHLTKLMLERKVHNVEELIETSTAPLENDKLFQRALRFADDEYIAFFKIMKNNHNI